MDGIDEPEEDVEGAEAELVGAEDEVVRTVDELDEAGELFDGPPALRALKAPAVTAAPAVAKPMRIQRRVWLLLGATSDSGLSRVPAVEPARREVFVDNSP